MSGALYRKYRPQTFAEVIGQEVVKTILQNALKSGRVSHAYLFAGPRGVGKTTVARLLAKTLNCLKPKDGEPDTACENCLAVQAGRFLDLIEIDAASYTGVDNIRELIEHVKFAPSKGKYKVFIVDEVHMLSRAAFNALLKTLEEPPAHAVFILATTELYKVPATIVSRSQKFDFKRVSAAEIQTLLARVAKDLGVRIGQEPQLLIAQGADGSFRDALSILDQLLAVSGKEITLAQAEQTLGLTPLFVNQRFLDLLGAGRPEEAAAFLKKLADEGKDTVQFCRNFLEYLRLVLFVKLGVEDGGTLGLGREEAEVLKRQAAGIAGQRLLALTKLMLEAYREARHSPEPEIAVLVQALAAFNIPEGPANPAIAVNGGAKPESLEVKAETAVRKQGLALGSIVDRWAEVLGRVKEYNHSLLSSLRLGRLVALSGDELLLAFPYNFHKETVEARKNRIVVEQVLEEVFERPVKIKVALERELDGAAVKKSESDLLSEAMKVLGGED